jgi:ribulose-phosphate 3-epimerase
MVMLFPSLIAANILELKTVLQSLEPICDGFHIDVMDFHFVDNLTWGPDTVNALRAATSKQFLVHLMVDYPEKYFSRLELAPNDVVSIHIESKTTLTACIQERNWQASIALNPHTPLEVLISTPAYFNHILLMSVHPGFSGQKLIPTVLYKLQALVLFRQAHSLDFTIALDGGINTDTIGQAVSFGAEQLVVGSAVFNQKDPVQALENLKKLA